MLRLTRGLQFPVYEQVTVRQNASRLSFSYVVSRHPLLASLHVLDVLRLFRVCCSAADANLKQKMPRWRELGWTSMCIVLALMLMAPKTVPPDDTAGDDSAAQLGDGSLGSGAQDASGGDVPPPQFTLPNKSETSRMLRDEFGKGFGKSLIDSANLYARDFGVWRSNCSCSTDCFAKGDREAAALGPIEDWGNAALRGFINETIQPWREGGGFTMGHHVSMVSCSYRTRTHWNPTGAWIHISGPNVTLLRNMVDGYQRHKRILSYVREVVAKHPISPPLAVYISTTDTPCNPQLPYFTFFAKRGVRGIAIPDDSFVGGAQKDWSTVRRDLTAVARNWTFTARRKAVFFRGSPTHRLRQNLMVALQQCCANESDVKLAVMEKFKSMQVPLRDHAAYRYLMAIRGRTAASRDKYLSLLNSTVLWAREGDEDESPWFQFYHTMWRPWVNYVPVQPDTAQCTLKLLDDNEEAAARLARRANDIGAFLTQERVDLQLVETLKAWRDAQDYKVDPDPIEFVRTIYHFVKRHYKNTQVMPDDRNPVKFIFSSWLKRRVRQMMSCRANATQTFSYHRQTGCWYM